MIHRKTVDMDLKDLTNENFEKYFTFEITINLADYEIDDTIYISEPSYGYINFNDISSGSDNYDSYYVNYHYKNESELTNEIKEKMYKKIFKIAEDNKIEMLNNFEKLKKDKNIQNIIRKQKLNKINNGNI